MMAISAVDNALWDLRGKAFGRPTGCSAARRARPRRLLRLDARALAGARARARARRGRRARVQGPEVVLPHGPIHGLEGMDKNVELVRTVREAVGPNVEIMLDSWMGWNRPYTIRLAERIEQYHPRWIEESVPPDRIDRLRPIRRNSHPDRDRRARVHPLGLPGAAPGRGDRRDPGRSGLVRRHHRAGQDLRSWHRRTGAVVIPHGHSIHAAVHVDRRPVAVRLPDGRVHLEDPAGEAAVPQDPSMPENGSIALRPRPASESSSTRRRSSGARSCSEVTGDRLRGNRSCPLPRSPPSAFH